MLKPRDLANVDFRTAWRGYNQDDVDEFVRRIVGAYEELYQQNLRLEEQADDLRGRIDEFSQAETQIDETLALARQTSADVKAAAEERAKAIVAEAKVRADEVVRQARREAEEHMARAQELTRQERAFRERFRDLLEAYWALLEEERRDAEQLTQSIMTVAGQVAAAGETDGPRDFSTEQSDFGYSAEAEYEEEDIDDFYEDFSGYDVTGDEAPTRRMDAMDVDDER